MTDPRGVHSAHLDAETIAAFVDRTLDPAARAAAEAHLAGCAGCREVWVETSELANEEAGGATVNTSDAPAARSRSRRWIYGGAGLAVAAAVALVVLGLVIGLEHVGLRIELGRQLWINPNRCEHREMVRADPFAAGEFH